MMARDNTVTIVSYAVNGLGLGHITRLVSVNHAIRQLCLLTEQSVHQIILTTSEADTLAFQHGFCAYKLPSITVVNESGISKSKYNSLSRHWIWNCFALWQPDITIVDTFPTGSFDELPQILKDSRKNVFINRYVKSEHESNNRFKETLLLYDLIIRVNEPHLALNDLDERLEERVLSVPPIILEKSKKSSIFTEKERSNPEILSERKVLVLAGGGGDSENRVFWDKIIEVAQEFPNLMFICAVGILYRGDLPTVRNIVWQRTELNFEEPFDFAISAGGFNSVYELLFYKIPTAFFSQYRKYDDQARRIQLLSEQGLCMHLEETTESSLKNCITIMLSMSKKIREKLSGINYENGNLQAAFSILSLINHSEKLLFAKKILDAMRNNNIRLTHIDEKAYLGIIARIVKTSYKENNHISITNLLTFVQDYLTLMHRTGYSMKDSYTLIKKYYNNSEIPDSISEKINYLIKKHQIVTDNLHL